MRKRRQPNELFESDPIDAVRVGLGGVVKVWAQVKLAEA